ncbi:MAG: PAS domain-containing protein [Firmicutes bacterium]|nr:PAS domain-containing protein [Bacillota bacterium]
MNYQRLLEYKFFIDALPDIILIIKDGKIILANKKAEEVQTALIGADISDFIKSSFERAQYRLSLLSEETKVVGPTDYEVTLKSGEKRQFEMISTYFTIDGMPATLTTA